MTKKRRRKLGLTRQRRYLAKVKKFHELQENTDRCTVTLNCNEKVVGLTNKCLKHWSMNYAATARRCGYTRGEFSKIILAIWHKQKGKCAITNLELVPGLNVEVDHIIPRSRGGDNTPGNLRLVHRFVNQIKSNLTDLELKNNINIYCPLLIKWAQKEIDNNGI